MGRDVEVLRLAAVVAQDDKHVKDLEANRGHRNEVH